MDPKLPIGRESEFRDMNPFSGIGIVSLEFQVLTSRPGRSRIPFETNGFDSVCRIRWLFRLDLRAKARHRVSCLGRSRGRIAAVLGKQMIAVDKARAVAEEELNTINALPAALLRRAFSGEL